jgi:hypothetical protein
MSEPQEPAAAAGRDWFRAGHADREQVIEALKDAFVHGRLTRDQLGLRAGRALTARTYADLAALTADIPPGRPQPGRRSHPPHPPRPPRLSGLPAGRWPGRRYGRAAPWSSRSLRRSSISSPIRAGRPAPFPVL